MRQGWRIRMKSNSEKGKEMGKKAERLSLLTYKSNDMCGSRYGLWKKKN